MTAPITKISPDIQPASHSAPELLEAANAYMQERGLTAEMIDPKTVVVALHGPKVIDSIHAHTHPVRVKSYSGEEPLTDQERQLLDDTSELDAHRHKLSKGRRVRRYLAGVAVSAALTAGSIFGFLDVDANMQERRTDVPTSIDDVTSHDSSILPGNVGAQTPFLRSVRNIIPGIPERSPFETTREVTQERQVQERQVRVENEYTTADSANPVATDLTLTGEEYQLAHDAAEELVASLGNPNRFNVTSFGAFGRASDEFNGTLGKLDPEQRTLYLSRALIAARALSDVLHEQGFTVLVDPHVDGEEVVLTPEQIATLNGQELDQELARGRVSELQIEGTKEVVRNVPRTRLVETKQSTEYGNDLNTEAMAAILMGGFLYLSKLTRTHEPKRAANRAARRQLAKAERKHAVKAA